MKAIGTKNCAGEGRLFDLYAQLILLRKEVEKLESATFGERILLPEESRSADIKLNE
jgi:hypothetical protein